MVTVARVTDEIIKGVARGMMERDEYVLTFIDMYDPTALFGIGTPVVVAPEDYLTAKSQWMHEAHRVGLLAIDKCLRTMSYRFILTGDGVRVAKELIAMRDADAMAKVIEKQKPRRCVVV